MPYHQFSFRDRHSMPPDRGNAARQGVRVWETVRDSTGSSNSIAIRSATAASKEGADAKNASLPIARSPQTPLQPIKLFPNSPNPQIIAPTTVATTNEDASISGTLRVDARSRSNSIKRSRDGIDELIGNLLDKKKKTKPEPKNKAHKSRTNTKIISKI